MLSRYERKKVNYRKFWELIFVVILTAVVSISLYNMYIKIQTGEGNSSSYDVQQVDTTKTLATTQEKTKDITDILEDVSDSVVGISKMKNLGSAIFTQNSEEELGLGSGVIVSANGYILTNWHVSGDKLSSCYVNLSNGNGYTGKVVWADKDLDLSIVKINMTNLKYIKLADSDVIKVGQTVYAIGNPIGFEFQRTVTRGIISGKDRTIKLEEDDKVSYMEDLIQTDATINPGNSGGPLIDENGNVIGINTVKITSAEGIGFAVPINVVKTIIASFTANGSFTEAYLGLFGYDKEVIPYLDSNVQLNSGVYVAKVSLDGPLRVSGVKEGDIITKIDDIEINKITDLREYIYTKNPNDVVNLSIYRNNKAINVSVKLSKR